MAEQPDTTKAQSNSGEGDIPPVPGDDSGNESGDDGANAPVVDEMPKPQQGRRGNSNRSKTKQDDSPPAPVVDSAPTADAKTDVEQTAQDKAREKRAAQELLESGAEDTPAARLEREIDKGLEALGPGRNLNINPDELSDDVEVLRRELIERITIVQRLNAEAQELRSMLTRYQGKAEAADKASRTLSRLKKAIGDGDCLPVSGARVGKMFLFAMPICSNAKGGSIGMVMTFMAEADENFQPVESTIRETTIERRITATKDGTKNFYIIRG